LSKEKGLHASTVEGGRVFVALPELEKKREGARVVSVKGRGFDEKGGKDEFLSPKEQIRARGKSVSVDLRKEDASQLGEGAHSVNDNILVEGRDREEKREFTFW